MRMCLHCSINVSSKRFIFCLVLPGNVTNSAQYPQERIDHSGYVAIHDIVIWPAANVSQIPIFINVEIVLKAPAPVCTAELFIL